jgi:hypothetical protein
MHITNYIAYRNIHILKQVNKWCNACVNYRFDLYVDIYVGFLQYTIQTVIMTAECIMTKCTTQ